MGNKKILTLVCLLLLIALALIIYPKTPRPPTSDNSSTQGPTKELTGNWKVVSIKEGEDEFVFDNKATLSFKTDGSCSAEGGCNVIANCTYEVKPNNELSMTMSSTKKKCSNDIVEFSYLYYSTTYEIENNHLRINYEKENGIRGFVNLEKLPF